MKVKTMMAAMALALLAGPLVSQSTALAAAPSRPFGSHPVAYTAGSVLPSAATTSAIRGAIASTWSPTATFSSCRPSRSCARRTPST